MFIENNKMKKYLILDVGGTKTHIALISTNGNGQVHFLNEKLYKTNQAASLEEIIFDFHNGTDDIEAIAIAIAGPIINDRVQLTNVPWIINKAELIKTVGVKEIYLLNDLEASAIGVPFLPDTDLRLVYHTEKFIPGNAAIIAPGTGLGEAAMYWDGDKFHPFASEGGHCDFSPRDKTDIDILMFLQHKFGHVSWERVVSGQGIANIFEYLRTSFKYNLEPEKEAALLDGDVAANISQAAQQGEKIAINTMSLFTKYLAIESANVALKYKSTGGLYIGGGIIPKIWNLEYQELFLKYFFKKGRLEGLLRCMDVSIVLNPKSVLFGAAHYLISKNGNGKN